MMQNKWQLISQKELVSTLAKNMLLGLTCDNCEYHFRSGTNPEYFRCWHESKRDTTPLEWPKEKVCEYWEKHHKL